MMKIKQSSCKGPFCSSDKYLHAFSDRLATPFRNVLEEGSNEVAVENAIALFVQSSEAEQPTVHNFCSNFDKKYLKELNVALLRQDLEDPEVCFSWASFQKCLRRRLRGMIIATFGHVEQAGLDCPKSLSPNRKATGQETTARKGEVTSQETITRKQKSPVAPRNRKTIGVTWSDSLVTGIQHSSRAKKTFRSEEERALIAQLYEKHKNGYPKWKLIRNEAAPYLDHLTTQQIQDCVKTLIKQGHVAP